MPIELENPDVLARLTPQQQWIAIRLQTDTDEAVAEEMDLSVEDFRERYLEPISRILSRTE